MPILLWNAVFTRFLPPALASTEFSRDIPPLVGYGENTLRVVLMVLPFPMPLEVATVGQRRGLLLFTVGTLLYFLAWVPLMVVPQSRWSTSWLGFVAPAYTPLIWLAGLGLIGRRLYPAITVQVVDARRTGTYCVVYSVGAFAQQGAGPAVAWFVFVALSTIIPIGALLVQASRTSAS